MQEFNLSCYCILILSQIWLRIHLELFFRVLVKIDFCIFPTAKLFQKWFRNNEL